MNTLPWLHLYGDSRRGINRKGINVIHTPTLSIHGLSVPSEQLTTTMQCSRFINAHDIPINFLVRNLDHQLRLTSNFGLQYFDHLHTSHLLSWRMYGFGFSI